MNASLTFLCGSILHVVSHWWAGRTDEPNFLFLTEAISLLLSYAFIVLVWSNGSLVKIVSLSCEICANSEQLVAEVIAAPYNDNF
jgi:hypothetical protein